MKGILFFALISTNFVFAQINDFNLNWLIPVPDTTIAPILETDPLRNKTYVAGNLEFVKNSTPRIGTIDPYTNEVLQTKLKVNGTINVSIQDSSGGYYIAGEFTEVNGQIRNRIAHIDQYNFLTPFNASVDDSVICMSLYDGKLYFGGEFTTVNGINRTKVAAVDAVSGNLISWSPSLNGDVYSILASPQGVFIGGYFTYVNSIYSPYMACINAINGTLNTWNHYINGPVFDFKIKNGFLYTVGSFSQVFGQLRDCFAQFNLAGLTLTSLNIGSVTYDPGEWGILGLEILNDNIYLYGQFDAIDTNLRENIAVFDMALNQISPITFNANGNFFIPNFTGIIHDALVKDNFIYFGGLFQTINGNPHPFLFRADTLTSVVDNWNVNLDNQVYSISNLGNNITICGEIKHIGNLPATQLMTFETDSGELSNIQHTINGLVKNMEVIDNSLIVLGDFNEFNGVPRSKLAIVDLNTNLLTNFNTTFFDSVNLSTISKPIFRIHRNKLFFNIDSIIYSISLSNPENIQEIVALNNIGIGNPAATIRSFLLFGDTLIINGLFNSLNGNNVSNLTFYSIENELILNSFSSLFENVSSVTMEDNLLYYSEVNSSYQYSIFSLNLLNLNQTLIQYLPDYYPISTLSIANNQLYFSGYNFLIDQAVVNKIDLTTNTMDTWMTFSDNLVHDIEYSPGKLFLVGNFHLMQGLPVTFLSVFNTCETSSTTNITTSCSYNWNGNIYSVSGIYKVIFLNYLGCDSIAYLNLEILNSESYSEISTCSQTYITPISNYNSSGNFQEIYQNIFGCDSTVYLSLTFTPFINLFTNSFSLPSSSIGCNGQLAVSYSGGSPYQFMLEGNGSFNSMGYSTVSNLCPGIYDLTSINACSDSVFQQIIIPVDSNYVFNNPFIDSIAVDSLGTTITNCDIYYNSIDTAYIDSLWATGNQVNVIWNIVDSNGSNLDTTTYDLNNGSGVYWLQLSVFCPTKAVDDYFAVTQAIYFGNGGAYLVGLEDFSGINDTFEIYPNPTSGNITFSFNSDENRLVQIYNAQGKLIVETFVYSGESINLDSYEKGIYFFRSENVLKKIILH